MSIREPLQTAVNVAETVRVTLYFNNLFNSYDVMVWGLTPEAEDAIADGSDWPSYKTLEDAQQVFDRLTKRWAWFGAGQAPAMVEPVVTGLTVDYVNTIRALYASSGWTQGRFEAAMGHLRSCFEGNKALSKRSIDWADNLHGHRLA